MRGKTHCAIGILACIQLSVLASFSFSIHDIIISAIFSTLPDLDKSNSIVSGFIFSKKTSERIYKFLIYTLNILIFYILIRMNADFLISGIISFIIVIMVEKKVGHYHVRKILISFSLITVSLLLFAIKADFYFIIPGLVFATFPWLKHRNFSHSILMIFLVYIMIRPIEILTNMSGISFLASFSYGLHIFCDMFTRRGVALFYPLSEKKISIGYLRVGGKFANIIEKLIVFSLFVTVIISLIKHFVI